MVHEVQEKVSLFSSLKNILNDNGKVLLVEPKLFHVSKKEFSKTLEIDEKTRFKITEGPKLQFIFSTLLNKV